jgi:hypothetical protein
VEKEAFLRTYLGGRRLVDLDKFALVTAVNLLQCIRSSDTQHYNRSTLAYMRSWLSRTGKGGVTAMV